MDVACDSDSSSSKRFKAIFATRARIVEPGPVTLRAIPLMRIAARVAVAAYCSVTFTFKTLRLARTVNTSLNCSEASFYETQKVNRRYLFRIPKLQREREESVCFLHRHSGWVTRRTVT